MFSRIQLFVFVMLAVGLGAQAQQVSTVPKRVAPHLSLSPIILADRPDAVQEYSIDPQAARSMVNHALTTLTSAPDVATAWTRLGITPQDTVGIKISTAGGSGFCTHRAVVQAVVDGLEAAGVPAAQIIVWDRLQRQMTAAGYAPQPSYARQPAYQAVVPALNYDPNSYYRSGIFGNLMWGDYQFGPSVNSMDYDSSLSERSYYTRFVTTGCTKIVNIPVLSCNEYFGIDACLSSLALGATDNNRRFQGPPSYGDPSIPMLYNQSFIRHKTVVQILDALVAQCAGGPAFQPQFCQALGSIYVGRDPVAIDSLALPRIERMRHDFNVPNAGNTSTYVTSAAVLGLGTTDRRRIQLLKLQ